MRRRSRSTILLVDCLLAEQDPIHRLYISQISTVCIAYSKLCTLPAKTAGGQNVSSSVLCLVVDENLRAVPGTP